MPCGECHVQRTRWLVCFQSLERIWGAYPIQPVSNIVHGLIFQVNQSNLLLALAPLEQLRMSVLTELSTAQGNTTEDKAKYDKAMLQCPCEQLERQCRHTHFVKQPFGQVHILPQLVHQAACVLDSKHGAVEVAADANPAVFDNGKPTAGAPTMRIGTVCHITRGNSRMCCCRLCS